MSIPYHGNWCGPGWSAGSFQPSVVDDSVIAIDDFDRTCQIHDGAYATGADLDQADMEFYNANIRQGGKRALAAIAVRMSQHARHLMTKKNLRGSNNRISPKAKTPSTKLTTVPASYGYTLSMRKPIIQRSGNTSVITGSDFASSVTIRSISGYAAGASVLLNPAYFNNASLGVLARTYEKFRFTRAILEYVPAVSTFVSGQIVITSTRSCKEPFLDGGSTTFLSRALSQGNATAGPIWQRHVIEIDCLPDWKLTDPLIDADLDDSVAEEVQVYANSDTDGIGGTLILHYTVEFKEPLYTFHPTLIPVPIGNGIQISFSDDTAINAVNDAIKLSNSSVSLPSGNGNIYRLVFQQDRSTLPTPIVSWASVAKFQTLTSATTSTTDAATTTFNLVEGVTLYGIQNGSVLSLNTSYEACLTGNASGSIFYNSATTAAGTWWFIAALVRLGDLARITNQ